MTSLLPPSTGCSIRSDAWLPASQTQGGEIGWLKKQYIGLILKGAFVAGARFSLDRTIGKGRQGVVYRSRRAGARRCLTEHAIKLFDPGNYPTAQAYRDDMNRISRQVADLHRNRSPNLVDCDSYEEIDGIGLVQMELIDGINLSQLLIQFRTLQNRPLTRNLSVKTLFNQFEGRNCVQPGVVVYIMRQILEGLENLHSENYLHCDLKPSNIMLDNHGYVRVIDFGRATRVDDDKKRAFATPVYASPEYHADQRISIQSDIYSVGLVGLELIRGCPLIAPLTLGNRKQLYEHKMRLYDRVEQLLPAYVACNRELVAILKRFVHPDPEKRFHNALVAESSSEGLAKVHRQLTRMDIDSDYRRDLAAFVRQIHRLDAD